MNNSHIENLVKLKSEEIFRILGHSPTKQSWTTEKTSFQELCHIDCQTIGCASTLYIFEVNSGVFELTYQRTGRESQYSYDAYPLLRFSFAMSSYQLSFVPEMSLGNDIPDFITMKDWFRKTRPTIFEQSLCNRLKVLQ